MRFLFISLVLSILSLFEINGQMLSFQKPDYKLIQSEISNKTSNYYYPKLLNRLKKYDNTLTEKEYSYLYYGYIFQKEYNPFWNSKQMNELKEYYQKSKLEKDDLDRVIFLAKKSIEDFPFDLRQMNFLAYTYHLKGDDETAMKIANTFQGLVNAIMSTGDGQTCDNGFHVIYAGHEYVLMNIFHFNISNQSLTGDCDYISLDKNSENINELYFKLSYIVNKDLFKHKI